MPDKPKIKRLSADDRRWRIGVMEVIVPELKPDELSHLEGVIEREKQRRKNSCKPQDSVVSLEP